MPRGGSKKGERRGGRAKGTLNKKTVAGRIAAQQMLKLRADTVNMSPKEVLVACMRDVLSQALNMRDEINKKVDAGLQTQAVRRELRGMWRDYNSLMTLAGDFAYKAAPFVHARLTAVAQIGGEGGGDGMSALRSILDAVNDHERKLREDRMRTIQATPEPAQIEGAPQ